MSSLLDRETAARLEEEASKTSAAKKAEFLQKSVGQQMTAYMLGLSDSRQVGRYIKAKHVPHYGRVRRLTTGFRVVRAISGAYDVQTAKAWLFGSNTRLGDRAPIGIIREATDDQQLKDVWLAAKQFASS